MKSSRISPRFLVSQISVKHRMEKHGKMASWVDIISLPNLLCPEFSPIKLLFEILGERLFSDFTDIADSANLGEYLCKQSHPAVNITGISYSFFHRIFSISRISVQISSLCKPIHHKNHFFPSLISQDFTGIWDFSIVGEQLFKEFTEI